ncbi:MAG: hypothetical protein ISP90_00425 [Nevskia sp.]|nr:hypothetical protein [Nevskia sp.]
MKREMFTVRLAPELAAEVSREAQRRGITRTTWASQLIERGMVAEALDGLLSGDKPAGPSSAGMASAVPPDLLKRVVFAACFSEAILKKLNASLNRSSSELGIVATQARDQAEAETAALLKSLNGAPCA